MQRKETINAEEKLYIASQWQLMWRKFIKHKLAIFGGGILLIFYIVSLFCEFFATQDIYKRHTDYIYCSPQRVRFFDENGFHPRPFVYGMEITSDPVTWERIYTVDKTKKYPIHFFYSWRQLQAMESISCRYSPFWDKRRSNIFFIWCG